MFTRNFTRECKSARLSAHRKCSVMVALSGSLDLSRPNYYPGESWASICGSPLRSCPFSLRWPRWRALVYKADAMSAYCLSAAELEGLECFDDTQPRPRYTRADVRRRAWRRWGCAEALEQAKLGLKALRRRLRRAKSKAKRRAKASFFLWFTDSLVQQWNGRVSWQ